MKLTQPINELYLLINPYYAFREQKKINEYKEIWFESISMAAKKEEIFGRLYFHGRSSERDNPNKLHFASNPLTKEQRKLGKHFQQSFGKQGQQIFMMDYCIPFEIWLYDPGLEKRIQNPNTLRITARGVFVETYVDAILESTAKLYKAKERNADIRFSESVFKEKENAELLGYGTD